MTMLCSFRLKHEDWTMKVGYARVSTDEQKLDLQITALRLAGCNRIYQDQGISGAKLKRPGLNAALRALHPGQTLVVWRLDRLGRSLLGLVELVNRLGERGVDFQSLNESIDTASNGGRLIFHIMAALAEFERALISERTKAGLAEARARGNRLGRPPALTKEQVKSAWREVFLNEREIGEIAHQFGVSERTMRRHLTAHSPRISVGAER